MKGVIYNDENDYKLIFEVCKIGVGLKVYFLLMVQMQHMFRFWSQKSMLKDDVI